MRCKKIKRMDQTVARGEKTKKKKFKKVMNFTQPLLVCLLIRFTDGILKETRIFNL